MIIDAWAQHPTPPPTPSSATRRSSYASWPVMVGKKVLFGSNWPMIAPQKCLQGLEDLPLDKEGRKLFLSGNAARVFGLHSSA